LPETAASRRRALQFLAGPLADSNLPAASALPALPPEALAGLPGASAREPAAARPIQQGSGRLTPTPGNSNGPNCS
jgi:hypothetical protein